ncbi:alanine racemase [Pseudodesulfovibrio sediminis]|uniref:Alanine racemase n=1 Tax=Pseudodesulfovibrio sediminis TaxID=2810563 RepID=A0ABN6ETI4_9BACT|nr:alanine racemase [Pseudodesulfovibrio sediminis]BCS88490.1 alanine racemase [Pseudodesulfovibrio sediminis]
MIEYNKLRVRVHLDNLRHNYRTYTRLHDRVIPVIKSDAYGHGLLEVSRALESEGVDTFAVGFVHEAAALRQGGCDKRILALLGPIDAADDALLWEHEILAAVSHFDQLRRLVATAETNGPLAIGLKFDTGMRRLGFLPEELPQVIEILSGSKLTPVMISSHLASADTPGREVDVEGQHAQFQTVIDGLAEAGFEVEANLANSAGALAFEQCRLSSLRQGITLYGGNPFCGTSLEALGRELKPAMDVVAPVMQVHPLKKGESISYGWTYTAEADSVVAVIGVGYADNYSRSLSNTGEMLIHGTRVPIRGRVCMQMTAVDVTALMGEGKGVAPGDEAYLLGGPGPETITPEEMAGWWGSISYEVFCLLGMNQREYI